MTFSKAPDILKKFRRAVPEFQATFQNPLKNLEPFVSAILADEGGFEKASVTIEQIVFEPKKLISLMASHSISETLQADSSVEAQSGTEVRELLRATLSEWIDFLFVPTPKPFLLYADHDEYTTLFANTKSKLEGPRQRLLAGGFKQIENWRREF